MKGPDRIKQMARDLAQSGLPLNLAREVFETVYIAEAFIASGRSVIGATERLGVARTMIRQRARRKRAAKGSATE